MKLIVARSINKGYMIRIEEGSTTDNGIANYLDLPIKDYIQILINNNAFLSVCEYYFYTIQDAKNAIKDLEPYLIMITLTK